MLHTNRGRVHRRRTPADATGWRRRRHIVAPIAAAALMLRAAGAGAAAYLPGAEPDPPTGVAAAVAVTDTSPAGNGIRWELAPVRTAGSVSLDGRWLRLEDGSRTTQGLVFNDVELATHVWQPWFIQLNAGVGALAARDSTRGVDTPATQGSSTALTGRFAMAVFPVSRFPFELRAEVSDSRVSGDTLGTDYRTHRLSLNQSYRPDTGNDSYTAGFEYNRQRANDGGDDTVSSLRGTALRQFVDQTVELSGQLTLNDRHDTGDSSRIASLAARHTFQPASSLHVDTLATWNQLDLHSNNGGSRLDSATDMRQLSSFATWRPREGEWLYAPESPLYLTSSVRLVDAGTDTGSGEQRLRAMNASLGASQELTREWRLAGSVSGTRVTSDNTPIANSATGNASLAYSPEGLMLGAWRYTPTLGGNLGASRSSDSGNRHTVGAQLAHGVARDWAPGESETVSVSLTQSLGALRDSQSQMWSRAYAHSLGLFWQAVGESASQSYAGLSLSDSRTAAQERGSFQLVNLQLSRRTQLSRHANWSGNLTLQASRSDTTQLDVFTATTRQSSPGWQRFYSGTLTYEHQRFLGEPRLRYTALLTANSQQFESRAAGDIDAPRERITESLENRLDYAIGRLEARLSARVARVDERNVASVFVRLQRRY
jgi:hypothetical protein